MTRIGAVLVDLLPGTSADVVRELADLGAIPSPPVGGFDGPALTRDPGAARRGDHLLLSAPERQAIARGSAAGARVWVRCTNLVEVDSAIAAGVGLWLHGSEAEGLCGDDGSIVLIQAIGGRAPFVVQGLGPWGSAAALAVGAAGVVLGPETWLASDGVVPPQWRRALATSGTQLLRGPAGAVRLARAGGREARAAIAAAMSGSRNDLADVVATGTGRWWCTPGHAAPAPAALPLFTAHAERSTLQIVTAVVDAIRDARRHPVAVLGFGREGTILAGDEAAGPIGDTPALVAWELGLRDPDVDRPVLAGGIAGGVGLALASALAAAAGRPASCRIDTTSGLTHEAIEDGRVSPAWQRAALSARTTVVVGGSVGLAHRVAPNAAARAVEAVEREHTDLGTRRIAVEALLGTLLPLGAAATLRSHLVAREELHEELPRSARHALGLAGPTARSAWGRVRRVRGTPSTTAATSDDRAVHLAGTSGAPIAVVGLGCILPGAANVPAYWANLCAGFDAIDRIPPSRWREDRYYDADRADARDLSRSYARVAGVAPDVDFDPKEFRIPPRVAASMDRSQQLALLAAREAIASAGWDQGGPDPRRAAVLLGNSMGGERAKDLAVRVRFREVVAALREAGVDVDGATEDRVGRDLDDRVAPVAIDSMAGILSNVIAGRVAAWLDWMGGNLTVDAACASSLAALATAVDWLRSGRCDAVLTGGVDTDLSAEAFAGFCGTRALSSGGSRPFAAGADGFVMGEGCAVFALERLSDARRRGDPVWAVIAAVGQASDGRGRAITAPSQEGQVLALRRAWDDVAYGPESLGMIEAHGTGTAVGDVTEVAALRALLADRPAASHPVWLGSVKSMLGHLKGAAGAAGLAKAVLGVATGVVPPTLHAAPINADLGLGDTPLRLPRHPTPLQGPGRAAVSAFGFGGTDFHAIVERAPTDLRVPDAVADLRRIAEPWVVHAASAAQWPLDRAPAAPYVLSAWAAQDPDALRTAVADDRALSPSEAARRPARLIAVHPPADRARLTARLAEWLAGGPPPPDTWVFPGGVDPAVVRVPTDATARHLVSAAVALAAGDPRPANHLDGSERGPHPAPPPRAAALFPEPEAPSPLLAPARAAPPGVPDDLDRDDPTALRRAVLDAIARATGYPPEYLEGGADLEADLGIDSIRKLEILGALQVRLGLASRDDDVDELAQADVDGLVAWLERRLADPGVAPVPRAVAHDEIRVTLVPTDAWLGDHAVGGRPLVPAAAWVRLLIDAVTPRAPQVGCWSVSGFEIRSPTFVDRARDDVRIGLLPLPGGGWRAEIRSDSAVLATADMLPADLPDEAEAPTRGREVSLRSLYRPDALFHGPSWRVLDRVTHDGNGRLRAAILPGGSSALASGVDGVHQLLSAWAGLHTGWLALPVGAKRWIAVPHADVPLTVEARCWSEGDEIAGSATVTDASGRVVLVGEHIRLRPATRWPAGLTHPLGPPRG